MVRLWCLPLLGLGHTAAQKPLIKGVSYGPVPVKSVQDAASVNMDDWMSDAAKPLWGSRGRNDLRVIQELGANVVRLYGNNPEVNHKNFLDEADKHGLKVIPGLSDYPYYQNPAGNCRDNNFDCYDVVKTSYSKNLVNGFLTPQRTYHPALAYFILMNEPDLKMPPSSNTMNARGPFNTAKAMASAFDAVLDAEKELGVVGPGINFTVSFSYAICLVCNEFNDKPGLGQMQTFQQVIQDPVSFGYTPRNNLSDAYAKRWTNSFNTANRASDLAVQFMDTYEQFFPGVPVFIAEYHHPDINQTEDLLEIMQMAERSDLFNGISYFEYQVAYWKGGAEEAFGMFGLGSYVIAQMPFYGSLYNVYCLAPVNSPDTGCSKPAALAKAYGGSYEDSPYFCLPSPTSVPLDDEGFQQIFAQQNPERFARFVKRVVQHMGALIVDQTGLESFAAAFVATNSSTVSATWAALVGSLTPMPAWAQVSPLASCIADREASSGDVGDAISIACSALDSEAKLNCADAPGSCSVSTYAMGDWVFSRYYQLLGHNPLLDCNFSGSAIYASPLLYPGSDPSCSSVLSPLTLPSTSAGVPSWRDSDGTSQSSSGAAAAATSTSTLNWQPTEEVAVSFRVNNVNFGNLSSDQVEWLKWDYTLTLHTMAAVPLEAIRDSQHKTGTIDLSSGSILAQGWIGLAPEVTADQLLQRLQSSDFSTEILGLTASRIGTSPGVITSALSLDQISIQVMTPSTSAPYRMDVIHDVLLPYWLWGLVLGLIPAIGCGIYVCLLHKRRSGRKGVEMEMDSDSEDEEAGNEEAGVLLHPDPKALQAERAGAPAHRAAARPQLLQLQPVQALPPQLLHPSDGSYHLLPQSMVPLVALEQPTAPAEPAYLNPRLLAPHQLAALEQQLAAQGLELDEDFLLEQELLERQQAMAVALHAQPPMQQGVQMATEYYHNFPAG